MNDRNYINSTLSKIKSALSLHRAGELETILAEIKSKGVLLAKTNDFCCVAVKWTDDDGNARSFFIDGYKRETQTYLKTNEILLEGEISPKAKTAFETFEKDQRMCRELDAYMSNTDMVDVKRTFPELKLFMNLVEKDRKEAKEEENAEWRRTYEICIELFGDDARG